MNNPSSTAAVLEAARAFGADVIEPNAEAWNDAGSVPREFFREAGAAGLCGLLVPTEHGGAGLDGAGFTAVLEILAGHCLASTFALVVHNNLAGAIAAHGSAVHWSRYLGPMLAGERVGAFLLTEPGAGSDAQAITLQARHEDDHWVLDGAKAWISNAVHGDVLCTYAQTAPGTRARGIAAFLVDADRDGVTRSGGYELLGGHALGTGGFTFRDCRVDDDALLHAPGAAFRAAMAGIDLARSAVAAMCCGLLARALDEALAYTTARRAFDTHVADFQAVQFMLADCATDLEAARALTARAVAAPAAAATLAAAHAKKFATRVAFERVATCMQVMGAAGLERARPLARHLAAAKISQYLDGASEIQNVVIARALVAARR
ncbi:MAG: acyl-CoA dehydrogenase family protein [Gammaproteobacteria bacterium]|nr:acyl-CoA dehydrogenase family protein [Gammaproteobacteria bacterium]MCP5200793.1 acyl-CoA dehydrogenase family protein [Gammaproteobacteria bacterium]